MHGLILKINTNSENFDYWLGKFVPRENKGLSVILHNGQTEILIDSAKEEDKKVGKLIKVLSQPKKMISPQGHTQYFIDTKFQQKNQKDTEFVESTPFPLFNLVESSLDKISIEFSSKIYSIDPYLRELARQISLSFPETKWDIQEYFYPFYKVKMDDLVFEYVLTVDPGFFMEWCRNEINFPNFTKINSKQEGLQIYGQPFGDYFLFHNSKPHWAFVIFANVLDSPGILQYILSPNSMNKYPSAIARLEMFPLGNSKQYVKCLDGSKNQLMKDVLNQLKNKIEIIFRDSLVQVDDPHKETKPLGPNFRTKLRADVFRKLKTAHPTWSQAKVAQEAIGELGEDVTQDTVRNTYRLMGWKWKRGDRIR